MEKGGFIVEEEQLSVQAGVPRREQCLVCSKPIFLAERFRVADRFYHRRCLRCARCQTQLTLGNFYETEVDGQFCCETCPDEEQQRRQREEDSDSEDGEEEEDLKSVELEREKRLAAAAAEEQRISSLISNRLAMFERTKPEEGEAVSQVRPNWRNSSLSDEQKSRSMRSFLKGGGGEVNEEEEEENSLPPPALPVQGPPVAVVVALKRQEEKEVEVERISAAPIAETEEEVVLRPVVDNLVRQSQSVSNIREMFEKKRGNREETRKTPIKIKLTTDEEEEKEKKVISPVERKENDRPESTSNFYTPIAMPRVGGRMINPNREDHVATQLDFKTPRKPSDEEEGEENWRDVKAATDREATLKGTDDEVIQDGSLLLDKGSQKTVEESGGGGGDGEFDEDVFLSPKPVKEEKAVTVDQRDKDTVELVELKAVEERVQLECDEDDEKDGDKDAVEREIVISLRDRPQVIEIATVPVRDDNDDDDDGVGKGEESKSLETSSSSSNNGRTDHQQQAETIEESSVTKESDPIIGEEMREKEEEEEIPSLLEISKGQEKEEEKETRVKEARDDSRAVQEAEVSVVTVSITPETSKDDSQYPLDLNPFGSDNEEEEKVLEQSVYNPDLNPFGDDEEEEGNQTDEKIRVVYRKTAPVEKKRISTNPFGSEEDEEEEVKSKSIVTPGRKRITPVATPRKTYMNQRPEPSPRSSHLRLPHSDYYGSVSSLSKSSDFRGSTNSLSSTCSSANTSGTYQRTLKKRRAPLPPAMREASSAEVLLLSPPARKASDASMVSDQSGQKSTSTSPRTLRKKRPAPKPPGAVTVTTTPSTVSASPEASNPEESLKSPPFETSTQELIHSTPLKLTQSTEEHNNFTADGQEGMSEILESQTTASVTSGRRVITVDDDLLDDQSEELAATVTQQTATLAETPPHDDSVFYRRVIKPLTDDDATPIKEDGEGEMVVRSASRQWEKLKQNKESENRNRQSLVSNSSDGGELDRFYNKSAQGKWKRRKGPAPSLPVPPKRTLQMLPIQEIRHELEVIEVQQQGLEKQGVQLEKMIREKTEGPDGVVVVPVAAVEGSLDNSLVNRNTSEVEGLIMQLFDLVVEKNELFRRQAELMYLRRQHRLEVEQADLEYEIRVLMAQPECNKTDSDKAKEETLISRLMEVVRQRNAVVDSLEMDRLREAQEDLGIKQELESYTAKRDEEYSLQKEKPVKLSKKEKKTLKEEKKKLKNKKLDVDKDYDETETDKSLSTSGGGGTMEKVKKKKKKFLIL